MKCWRIITYFIFLGVGFLLVDFMNDFFKVIFIIYSIAGVIWAGIGDSGEIYAVTEEHYNRKRKSK